MKVYKKALVTGGAQRIGASIAFYLANMGIDVAIQYNSSEKEMNCCSFCIGHFIDIYLYYLLII